MMPQDAADTRDRTLDYRAGVPVCTIAGTSLRQQIPLRRVFVHLHGLLCEPHVLRAVGAYTVPTPCYFANVFVHSP